jgi:succinate dehydrogenase/fumarate reductase cytochrome b subunit
MASVSIPVFHVAVGLAVLLAAAGVALAVVPALRRRRALLITWVLSVSALSLAALVNLVRLLHGL